MSEWFQSKVKFLRQMDNGLVKPITEQYLVDAMSFTEAEARVTAEIGEGMREVEMMAIAKSPIKEVVFYGDTDVWHKCKVQYVMTDEDTEKEKKVTTYLLVNSADVKEAYERCEEHLKEMLVPFTIPKIEESPIIDVYDYQQSLRGNAFQNTATDLKNETQSKADSIIESKIGAVDPTGGQEVAFEIDPIPVWLWESFVNILQNDSLTGAQAQEIYVQAEFPSSEFCDFMQRVHSCDADTATRLMNECIRFRQESENDEPEHYDPNAKEINCDIDAPAISLKVSNSIRDLLSGFGLTHLALWQIEEIKHAAASQPIEDFLGWMDSKYPKLSDDQASSVYEWCANDAAFDQDEDDGIALKITSFDKRDFKGN